MNWPVIILALFLGVIVARRIWARRGVVNVSVHEVHDRLQARDQLVLVDVREPHEFKAGHIRGAVNIPLGTLAQGAHRLDKGGEILLVCQSGNRSITAYHRLKAMGFTGVKNVEGGMIRWAWDKA